MRKQTIPEEIKKIVIKRDKGICQNCGKIGKILVDGYCAELQFHRYVRFEMGHIIPEYKGGTIKLGNLLLMCRYCNRSLGTKRWYSWLHRKIPEISKIGKSFNEGNNNTEFSQIPTL